MMTFASYSSSEINKLAQAMLRITAKLAPVLPDSKNAFVGNRYASLGAVLASCREALIAEGVWLVQYPVPVEAGHLGLVTKLIHAESGQWQGGLLVMPLPKNDPQGYGSAMTYARRYGLSALMGLITEADDDAEGAVPEQRDNVRKIRESKPGLASLPRIDGVSYQQVESRDGRACITTSGSTREKAPFLKEAGFRWDPQRKIWWRFAA